MSVSSVLRLLRLDYSIERKRHQVQEKYRLRHHPHQAIHCTLYLSTYRLGSGACNVGLQCEELRDTRVA